VKVKKYKDAKGLIKRQAAHFQVWVYDQEAGIERVLNW